MLTVLCLCFLLLSAVAHETGPQFRKFDSRNGSECVWTEQMDRERGLTFLVACYCKDAEKQRQRYLCQYDGPVEDCDAYMNDPEEFHTSVIKDVLGITILHSCQIIIHALCCTSYSFLSLL